MDSLKYLSSQQALADMAQFRSFVARKYKMSSRNRWIAYGGSYAGALAAWVRIKYPDSFHGAVATSAPVQAEFDFKQYLEMIENSLLTTVRGLCLNQETAEIWRIYCSCMSTNKKKL